MNKDLLNEEMDSFELQLENKHLEETIKIINEEILKYVSKRKYITEYILDYRKNVIEEYRDDEDKLIEYFDHERFVKEEAFKTIDRRLKELTALIPSPYFGKVSFTEEGYGSEEEIYIGKFGVMQEGSYEPTVVDWRAPVASLFYQGKLGEATYKAPEGKVDTNINLRRQFIIKNGKLKGMFDSELDVKDEILQMVLSSKAGEKLKDIIMTIQQEQDEIIRAERNAIVVVNGVAGSGKTTIALHRIAYLLYNYREFLQDKVLILGPNNIFMEYIASVLPSLGESDVKQDTFKDFALSLLEGDYKVMEFKPYIEKIINEDKDFINKVKYKNSREYLEELENFIKDLEEHYFTIEPLIFRGEIIVDIPEIKEMFNKYYSYMPLFRRSKKIKRILFSKLKDKRDEVFRAIEAKYKKYKESLTPEELKLQRNNIEFQRRNEIRDLIRDVLRIKEETIWLEQGLAEELYIKFNNYEELNQDDLAPMLYLKIKLEGLKLKENIRHIVIDEAQDYSELHFTVIKELTGCNSLTVVGDSNQRIIDYGEEQVAMLNLQRVFKEGNIIDFSLNKSYRSTKEIMDYANSYLKEDYIVPFVRSGKEVITKEISSSEELVKEVKGKIDEFINNGYESIAVICRTQEDILRLQKPLKENMAIKVMDREDLIFKNGVVLIPSYFAKGLEFDAVIIIDEKSQAEQDLIKYIMCTRALHELVEYIY